MRLLIAILLLWVMAPDISIAQTQKLSRAAPMGERTSMFGIYPYLSPNEQVSFPYYMIGPEEREDGRLYPLIMVLHGRSGHAYGAWVLADKIISKKTMRAFVVVPVMPEDVDSWTDKEFLWKDSDYPRPIDHVALLAKKILADFPADPRRVYVTGYSMGGRGTFGALYYYPDLFAAAVPVCGGWNQDDANKFTKTPLWAFHGKADKIVPVSETRDLIFAIQRAGGAPKYIEYPGVGHNSWIRAYNEPDLWTWLFSQTRP